MVWLQRKTLVKVGLGRTLQAGILRDRMEREGQTEHKRQRNTSMNVSNRNRKTERKKQTHRREVQI